MTARLAERNSLTDDKQNLMIQRAAKVPNGRRLTQHDDHDRSHLPPPITVPCSNPNEE